MKSSVPEHVIASLFDLISETVTLALLTQISESSSIQMMTSTGNVRCIKPYKWNTSHQVKRVICINKVYGSLHTMKLYL